MATRLNVSDNWIKSVVMYNFFFFLCIYDLKIHSVWKFFDNCPGTFASRGQLPVFSVFVVLYFQPHLLAYDIISKVEIAIVLFLHFQLAQF